MNNTIVIAIIAGAPGFLTALAAFVQALRNGRSATITNTNTAAVVSKIDEVHDLVNGNASKAREDLAAANRTILELKLQLAHAKNPAPRHPSKPARD